MKVLLLNASPKNAGATQEILSVIYSKISQSAQTSIVCLGDLDIQYCKGCKTCYTTKQPPQVDGGWSEFCEAKTVDAHASEHYPTKQPPQVDGGWSEFCEAKTVDAHASEHYPTKQPPQVDGGWSEFCEAKTVDAHATCKCVINDDMTSLIAQIDEADVIVIAAPSYWGDVPGQFKVFIDRCTVYSETNPNPHHPTLKEGKRCYAIALRMGTRPAECEHIIETIAHWCGHMKIAMADSIYFCEIKDKTTIALHTPAILDKAASWFNC